MKKMGGKKLKVMGAELGQGKKKNGNGMGAKAMSKSGSKR